MIVVNAVQLPFVPGSWYESLSKPPLTPPNWVFGVVWPVLYILIAISLTWWWQTRSNRSNYRNTKIGYLFVINLTANALYSPLLVGAQSLLLSFVAVSVVAVTSGLLIYNLSYDGVRDGTKNTPEFIQSRLLGPYHLWSLFALYLSVGLLILN